MFSIVNKFWQRFLSLSFILCQKKINRMSLARHWWNSTDLGLIDMFLCRNCCLSIIIQKIAPQAESGKYFRIWFFPRFGWGGGGGDGGVLSMRMQVILDSTWTLFSPARVQPLYGAGKRRVQRLDYAFQVLTQKRWSVIAWNQPPSAFPTAWIVSGFS